MTLQERLQKLIEAGLVDLDYTLKVISDIAYVLRGDRIEILDSQIVAVPKDGVWVVVLDAANSSDLMTADFLREVNGKRVAEVYHV